MRIIFYQILLLNMLLSSRCQNADMAGIKIKPLHPYSSSLQDRNTNEKKDKSSVTKFYFIEGASEATDALSKQVDSFILKHIKNDTDFVDFGGYRMDFYRKTKIINENFREVIDGMISHNTLDEHDEDLLYRYMWSVKDFMGCEYYKNGKVIKTVYDKGRDIFKRNPALPLPDTARVIIKEVTSNE